MAATQESGPAASRPKARDLNELIRYVMWSVFRVSGPAAIDAAAGDGGRAGLAAEVSDLCQQAAG
jgi:hydrogen peroxide-dependent heme synthase